MRYEVGQKCISLLNIVFFAALILTFGVNTASAIPPAIVIVSPLNQTYASATQVINATVTDATSAVSVVLAEINGSVNVTLVRDGTTNSYNATWVFSEGANNVRIYANDSAGNMNSSQVVYFTVDTVKPAITFVSPTDANGTMLTTRNYTFINVTLSESGAAWLDWNGTNQSMSGSGSSWYKNMTDLANSTYSYRVYANDSVGNLNVSEIRTISINVIGADMTPPSLVIVSPQNITYAVKNVTLNVSADENISAWCIRWTGTQI